MPDELRESFAKEMASPDFEMRVAMSARDERFLGLLSSLYGMRGE